MQSKSAPTAGPIERLEPLLAPLEVASNCSLLRVSFAPNRASTSSLIARLPPARADSADVWDNLVIDRANSALVQL